MARWTVFMMLALAGCAPPDVVGQRVGQSLYDASVNTGRALAVATDRTGQAIQDAGTNLRDAVNPPPVYALPPDLPPPYLPDGYAPPAPVTAEPLGPAPTATPPDPALGY
jgi:hypothetical protein